MALPESLERRILAPVRRGHNEELLMSDTAELETKLAFVEDTVRAWMLPWRTAAAYAPAAAGAGSPADPAS